MCGIVVETDDAGRIENIAPDREHLLSGGYSCRKGLEAHLAINSEKRILKPLKRQPDGSFKPIALETALDEIADKLATLIAEDGPQTVGTYVGTQSFFNVMLNEIMRAWLAALKSPRYFTTMTIDQSAKLVAAARLGSWNAGRQNILDADVCMLIGANPLVSRSVIGFTNQNVSKQLKAQKARGMKLIVVDPRRTETALKADIYLQIRPGEDVALLAGMLRLILENGWEDKAFCAQYVSQVDELRQAVSPFTPEYVETRSGISPAQLHDATKMFAVDAKIGMTSTATGASLAPWSNLMQHLSECLNVICGRYPRAGEPVRNPGVTVAPRPFRAEVNPPCRTWEQGYRGPGTGYGNLFGEMMTSTMPDEILYAGAGRLRSMFISGGNLAMALPDQDKAVRAFRALALLVVMDPFMSETAQLAHYILPPLVHYEHPDLYYDPTWESALAAIPFQQYIAPVSKPPQDAEVADEWYFFWAIAKRLGIQLKIGRKPVPMDNAPTTEQMYELLLANAQVPFDEVKQHTAGHVFNISPQTIKAPRAEATARFEVMPADVAGEVTAYLQEDWKAQAKRFRLISRRMLEVQNSFGRDSAYAQKWHKYNPAYMSPNDLSALGLEPGQRVEIVSDHGRIPARVAADIGLAPGTISMSHCWGGLPNSGKDYDEVGSNTNRLVNPNHRREAINAMPHMSAIPVDVVTIAG